MNAATIQTEPSTDTAPIQTNPRVAGQATPKNMTNRNTLLANREAVVDPVVLIPDPNRLANWENESPRPFAEKRLEGRFYRVLPETGRDVAFLIHLQQHVDKWASAETDGGIIIRADLLVGKTLAPAAWRGPRKEVVDE